MRMINPSEEELAVEKEDIRSYYKKIDQLDALPPSVVLVAWLLASEKENRRAIEKIYTIPRPDPILSTVTDAILYGGSGGGGGAGAGAGADGRKVVNRKKMAEKKAAPKPTKAFEFTVDVAQFNSTQAIAYGRSVPPVPRFDAPAANVPLLPRRGGRAAGLAQVPESTAGNDDSGAEAEPVVPIPIPQYQPVPSPWNQPTPPPTTAQKKRGRPARTAAAAEEGEPEAEQTTPLDPAPKRPRRGGGDPASQPAAAPAAPAVDKGKRKEGADAVKKGKKKPATEGTPGADKPSPTADGKKEDAPPASRLPTPWKDAPRPWDNVEPEVDRANMRRRAMESLGQPGPSKGFIAMTNVDADMKESVKLAVNELRGVRLCTEGNEARTVTHLLVGEPGRRTLKLLVAVANGSFLLDPSWVTASREQKKWLWERPFLLNFRFQGAAEQFRRNAEMQKPLPLAETRVFIAQPLASIKSDPRFICNRQSLTTLAEALGAKVVVAKSRADVVVIPGDNDAFQAAAAAGGASGAGKTSGTPAIVKAEWLCTCVERAAKVDVKEFDH